MSVGEGALIPTKAKIFIECRDTGHFDPEYGAEVIAHAVTENVVVLAEHLSSNERWSQVDMTSDSKKWCYMKAFPDGYELIWVRSGEVLT